jgi:hypothetical protein
VHGEPPAELCTDADGACTLGRGGGEQQGGREGAPKEPKGSAMTTTTKGGAVDSAALTGEWIIVQ